MARTETMSRFDESEESPSECDLCSKKVRTQVECERCKCVGCEECIKLRPRIVEVICLECFEQL